MTKQETINFIKKIKAYYQMFKLEEEGIEEWYTKLKPYDLVDVESKFEEHLMGDRADEPPKLHYITRYLKTSEEKEKFKGEYLIRCNLCGREMFLSEYENTHHRKCLSIKALIPILNARGNDVDYDTLDEYDYETLCKLWDKYGTKLNDMKDVLKVGDKE